jgi:hypothetical protein
MHRQIVNSVFMIAITVLVVSAYAAQPAPAGKVSFATGEVTASGASGSRALKRSDAVYSGDTVTTGAAGRARIRFIDDSVLTLVPDSSLRVDEYHYSADDAAANSSRYSLVKGGLRFVTGLVAKDRKENFRLETNAGYIGVRGTEFDVRACQDDCQGTGSGRRFPKGVYARVQVGAIVLTNDAGEIVAKAGEIAFMAHKGKAPQLVTRFPDQGFDVDNPAALPLPDVAPVMPPPMVDTPAAMTPPVPPPTFVPPASAVTLPAVQDTKVYVPPPTPPPVQ